MDPFVANLSREDMLDLSAYFAAQSQSEESRARFESIYSILVRALGERREPLDVGDIGCGAGVQSQLWAQRGHRVFALDVNEPLIRLAHERATAAGHSIEFRIGSASALPLEDQSLDVCIAADLIEHVPEWERCLDEFARVLRPRGVLFLNTSNRLCPVQQEFSLPLYSWYPTRLKRHYEELARTSRPELAGLLKERVKPSGPVWVAGELDAFGRRLPVTGCKGHGEHVCA